jgi:hypothetical protein
MIIKLKLDDKFYEGEINEVAQPEIVTPTEETTAEVTAEPTVESEVVDVE